MTTYAPDSSTAVTDQSHRTGTLSLSDLVEYNDLPLAVKSLITNCLALTKKNLSYRYGSANPAEGGMDCSGTVYYLLNRAGLASVPRDSSGLYEWAWKQGRFQAVVSANPATFELSRLRPGDLLFWTGTYRIDRDPPVTHVMIYLGTNRLTGRRVMAGASEGRTFNDSSRYGVSVFDFRIPRPADSSSQSSGESSRFIGYSPIPGLEKTASTATANPPDSL